MQSLLNTRLDGGSLGGRGKQAGFDAKVIHESNHSEPLCFRQSGPADSDISPAGVGMSGTVLIMNPAGKVLEVIKLPVTEAKLPLHLSRRVSQPNGQRAHVAPNQSEPINTAARTGRLNQRTMVKAAVYYGDDQDSPSHSASVPEELQSWVPPSIASRNTERVMYLSTVTCCMTRQLCISSSFRS